MKASRFEFRYRWAIFGAIAVLGYWAPWIEDPDIGGHTPLGAWFAILFSRVGHIPLLVMTSAAILFSLLLAGMGAALRVWGAAWIAPFVYDHKAMTAQVRPADGPYRRLRDPEHLGSWLLLVAVCLQMPIGGAVLALLLFTLLLYRLALFEEYYLTAELGGRYRDYFYTVPRWWPLFHVLDHAASQRPRWGFAVASEAGAILVFLTLAILCWRLDNLLVVSGIVVSGGVGLVAKALVRRPATHPARQD